MNLTSLHSRLLTDGLAVGGAYPLALTGGYGGPGTRLRGPAQPDLSVATENPDRMEDIATVLHTRLEQRGWSVEALEAGPLSARLIVTDPASHEECEAHILKEALWRPSVHTEYGLVLSLEDVVGTKFRALVDRGLARDLDRHAGIHRPLEPSRTRRTRRRHGRDSFDLSERQARLGGADWIDNREFAAYELDDEEIAGLRQRAQTWADDIEERLPELESPHGIGSPTMPTA
ncbi:hypothetical protein [Streptomyces sp. NPDC007346]|uniref:hypothetical protein n=1 Tax=Streptomyces sp. NPDC007346 TaxID=3154682 RepID=UPI003452D38F